MTNHPVLYSYRRCPYAMRARMAIMASGMQVEQREIVFWNKPSEMLDASPKSTVPVLILPDGQVIDESRDIMLWALTQSDALDWLPAKTEDDYAEMMALIDYCDGDFKTNLDLYKYAERFPEALPEVYRARGEVFIKRLESQLSKNRVNDSLAVLFKGKVGLVDVALFPFVRQFAHVDKVWFEDSKYPAIQAWLSYFLESDIFKSVMKNRPVWQLGDFPLWVDEPNLKTRDQFALKSKNVSS